MSDVASRLRGNISPPSPSTGADEQSGQYERRKKVGGGHERMDNRIELLQNGEETCTEQLLGATHDDDRVLDMPMRK